MSAYVCNKSKYLTLAKLALNSKKLTNALE